MLQPADCKSQQFKFLTNLGLPSLPLPCPHVMYVKVRERTALVLFFLLDSSVTRRPKGERMSGAKTLIASRLTYPFPQLDVQPCAANGKRLSEGHRLGMQLADSAPVLYR